MAPSNLGDCALASVGDAYWSDSADIDWSGAISGPTGLDHTQTPHTPSPLTMFASGKEPLPQRYLPSSELTLDSVGFAFLVIIGQLISELMISGPLPSPLASRFLQVAASALSLVMGILVLALSPDSMRSWSCTLLGIVMLGTLLTLPGIEPPEPVQANLRSRLCWTISMAGLLTGCIVVGYLVAYMPPHPEHTTFRQTYYSRYMAIVFYMVLIKGLQFEVLANVSSGDMSLMLLGVDLLNYVVMGNSPGGFMFSLKLSNRFYQLWMLENLMKVVAFYTYSELE